MKTGPHAYEVYANDQLDITVPQGDIEVIIRADRQVLWVNVGAQCRLRICRIGDHSITIKDESANANV